jgi:hypothetical protein
MSMTRDSRVPAIGIVLGIAAPSISAAHPIGELNESACCELELFDGESGSSTSLAEPIPPDETTGLIRNRRSGNPWWDTTPFVSAGIGVGTYYEVVHGTPWVTMGAGLGVRGGVMLPLGFRADVALSSMPYAWITRYEPPTRTLFSATGRIGWGIWIDSVYAGVQVGGNLWPQTFNLSVEIDWLVSRDNHYFCEVGAWSQTLTGHICGYGWRF